MNRHDRWWRTALTDQFIVAESAHEDIVARPASEGIGQGPAEERILPGSAQHGHRGLAGALLIVAEIDAPLLEVRGIGGRIQLQYARIDPDMGESTDRMFFRRLRPYIQGSINERWLAKIGLGRLPGDFTLRFLGREFYVPLASSLLLSVLALIVSALL